MKRTYASGHAKRVESSRKKKASIENVPKLTTFFSTESSNRSDSDTISDEGRNIVKQISTGDGEENHSNSTISEKQQQEEQEPTTTTSILASTTHENVQVEVKRTENEDSLTAVEIRESVSEFHFHAANRFPSDRGLYPEFIGDKGLKDILAKQGACQPNEDQISFPADSKGRKFSSTRYSTTTSVGMKVRLNWLAYSPTLNRAYCHTCWLFADRHSAHFRSEWINGIDDWSHDSKNEEPSRFFHSSSCSNSRKNIP